MFTPSTTAIGRSTVVLGISERRALLRADGMAASEWYLAGADIGGRKIARIEASAVTLTAADAREILELFAPDKPARALSGNGTPVVGSGEPVPEPAPQP